MIGVYSSQTQTEATTARLKNIPGFRDHPDGFTIDVYRVDEDHWCEGFGD